MALPAPVALDNTGAKVLPTAELKDTTFACIECAMPLVLVEGGSSSQCCHFAHGSGDAYGCPAGESLKIVAAQLVVAKYFTKIRVVRTCREGHEPQKQDEGCTASLEFRYVGHYPGDVSVLEDGKLKAIIEVKGPRPTMHSDLHARISHVGADSLWEVNVNTIIGAQSGLHSAEGNFILDATNHAGCDQCGLE